MAAKSPVRAMAGPEVVRMEAPNSLATTVASVVLPSPGGPENRIWSAGSPRPWAAAIMMPRDSFTFVWPR